MGQVTCAIDGCVKPRYQQRRLCSTHTMRLHRYGDLHIDRRRRRQPCKVDGCGKTSCAHGWCKEHYDRWLRCGDPLAVWTPQAVVGYGQAHYRVRQAHGPASIRACADCAGQASHWSYNHQDPNELIHEGLPYSLHAAYYEPRCVPCHKRFDLDRVGA